MSDNQGAGQSRLALYQFDMCPFCMQVRAAIKGLGAEVEIRDTMREPQHRQELIEGGGRATVPCLRIDHSDGRTEWMYESGDIIDFLDERFG